MRRTAPLLLVLALLATACSGSSRAEDEGGGATEAAPAGEAWSFTDDFGVTHELDHAPEVVVAEVGMAGALWDLGYEVDATFGPRELPDGTTDPLGLADPDAFASLGETYGRVNLEELRLLQPDIIVVPSFLEGQYWGIDDELADDVERVAPVVALSVPGRSLREMADRVAELAEALGVDLAGPPVTTAVAAYEEAEAALGDALADAPGLTFLAASGTPEQMYVAVPSGFPDLVTFQSLGMDIVAPDTDEQHWQALSWEEADTYEADVFLADSRGGSVEQILDFLPDVMGDLPALQAGQLARWEAIMAPGYANLARILDDLRAVVESADPDIVP